MGSGGSSSPRSFRLAGEVVKKRGVGAFREGEKLGRNGESGGLRNRVVRGWHNEHVRAVEDDLAAPLGEVRSANLHERLWP